jgi:putative MATE family efflux protein
MEKTQTEEEHTMTKSMTEGRPLPLILGFALPLLIGNLLQQTYNIIDAAIVGQVLGANALAGVGASSSVQFLVLGFCTGICAGFGIPMAKYFGAKDEARFRQCIFNAYLLTAFFAVIITTLTAVLCPQILHLLSTPDNIFHDAYVYLLIIFLGIPFTLFYNLLAGMLRSVGDSRTPFIFLAISTVLNIFLDLLCIVVLHLGCAGAALATIISQAISGISCFVYIQRRSPLLKLERSICHMDQRALGELVVMGIPMGLQYSITAIGSMVMQSANNGLGSVYVSGFTAASKIKQFALCPFDAIATGVSVFCGQNLGAGKPKRIKKGIFSGIAVGVSYGAMIGLVLIFFGRTLSLLFIKSEEVEVLDASALYLRCMGLFFWVIGFLNVLRMTIQGLGYSGIAIFSGFMEMGARILVSRIFVPIYGFRAICFTDQTAWIAATIYCGVVCIWVVKHVTQKLQSH